MALLIITTILWAFSFSFYGEYLAGHVDSYFAVLVRVGLAALVFLPFLRTRSNSLKTVGLYMLVGAMQLGVMYMLSFRAYLYLTVSELLLFTVLTPLYITLIYDIMSKRRLRWGYAFSALLAVIGAGIIRYDQVTDHFWTGLLLVQLSNITFAIGMVGYKRLMETRPMPQYNAFAWFYLGAFLVAVIAWFLLGNAQKMQQTTLQWGILVFLGDLLAVHKTQDVRNGQVVVARIDDEVTVKRLKKQGNKVELLPENSEFKPIVVDLRQQSFTIEGLAVGVIRNGDWL